MEYQKIENLLDNETNQPSKFRTRNWVEIDDESGEDILVTILNLKLILMSNLYNHADAYILVKGTITITGAGDDDAAKQADERNKGVIFKKLCTIYLMHKQNKHCRHR